MDEYDHGSLEWIHRVRDENYQRTKDIPLEQVIEESVKGARRLMGKG